MKNKFHIKTLGCKVNQYESDAIGRHLKNSGSHFEESSENCNICIINTCTVTQKASMQSRQAVRQAIRSNPDAKIIVTGCYAQTHPEEIRKIKGVDEVIGHKDKHLISEMILSDSCSAACSKTEEHPEICNESTFRDLPVTAFGARTRPVLKVQDGCNAFCSYCIVPYARGRSRSMPADDVISKLHELQREGFHEVILSGIHLGCYGSDLPEKCCLGDLLKRISRERSMDRIRLSSIEPHEVTDDIIMLVAESEHFCRHFHIPVQSGDNDILKAMRRPYTREYFRDLIIRIHSRIPDIAIGADVMIGFPGETEAAFENTFRLIEELPVTYLHVFPYSQRKNTPAAGFSGQVAPEKIRSRCNKLRSLGLQKKEVFYKSMLGKTLNILVEKKEDRPPSFLKGMSSNYIPVHFEGNEKMKNSFQKVIIERVDRVRVYGSVV